MSTLLHIETSTKNCSVSIANCGELISLKEINTGDYSHAEMLHPLINEALLESKLTIKEIEAIAVGKGPGSYTGLRIGVSAAKGLCFANDIPLISINSLEILAQSMDIDSGLIIPMIDARRMEVYAAIYDKNHNTVRETKAEIIDQNSFLDVKIEKDFKVFINECDLIIANRMSKELNEFSDKVFTRDLFGND